MKQLILAVLVLAASFTGSEAQTRRPLIRGNAMNQESRIVQGRHSGQLTRSEAMRLQRQQQLIRRDIRMARADGYISARERSIIRHRQAMASRNIYRQKHDYQSRR